MKLEGRKKDIFDILCEKKRISVSELSKTLYVCEMTIRRDLSEMEKQGLIKRYRGGAIFIDRNEFPISRRMYLGEDEKRILAQKSTIYLADNMNIYIDSSSTCHYIIPHIKKFRNIKIFTNSINALMLVAKLHIPCHLIGGDYYEQDMCFVGSISERYAENINVDLAFFSAKGISNDGIISDPDIRQTMVRYSIMKNAKKIIFLFEKEKIGKKYLHTLCRADDVDIIISDNEIKFDK